MQSRNLAYLPRIDHLRLVAALLVFGFHFFHYYVGGWRAWDHAPWLAPITEGHTGVALFFVLSGFIFMLIAQQGFQKATESGKPEQDTPGAIAYGPFLMNRVLRIAPLFLVVFFVAISLHRDQFAATDLFYLAFSNIGAPPTSRHFITGPAWSISVEFTFYLVFPFLALFTRQRGAAYLFGVLGLMAVIKLAAYGASASPTHMLYSTLIGRFDQFIWGMLAALLHLKITPSIATWPRARRYGLFALAATAIYGALMIQAGQASYFLSEARQPFWLAWGTIEALCWSAIILAYLALPSSHVGKTMVSSWAAAAGAWSFSFYMWHALVIYTLHHYSGFELAEMGGAALAATLLGHFAVALMLTLALARLSFSVIEAPFLALRRVYVAKG
jgi:peptidoglycan/LPS O-acetylase OafA/YrhL